MRWLIGSQPNTCLEADAEELFELGDDIIQVVVAQTRVDTDPEGLIHDAVGIGQLTDYAVVAAFKIGLAGQVTGEQQTGADLGFIQELDQLDTADAGGLLQGDREAEPGRF